MLKNYLIVSVVIVGSIIITPSFLITSNLTLSSVTSDEEQHSFWGIEWDEPHAERKYNITIRYTNENTVACILPIFVFITFLSFIIFLLYNLGSPSASIVHSGHLYLWNTPFDFQRFPQLKHLTHTTNVFVTECSFFIMNLLYPLTQPIGISIKLILFYITFSGEAMRGLVSDIHQFRQVFPREKNWHR